MYWKKFAVRRPLPQKGKEVVLAALMNGFVRPVCVNMVEFHDTFWHWIALGRALLHLLYWYWSGQRTAPTVGGRSHIIRQFTRCCRIYISAIFLVGWMRCRSPPMRRNAQAYWRPKSCVFPNSCGFEALNKHERWNVKPFTDFFDLFNIESSFTC